MVGQPILRWLRVVVCLAALAVTGRARADGFGLITGGDEAKQPVVETGLGPWLRANGHPDLKVGEDALDAKQINQVINCFILADQACGQVAVASGKLDGLIFVMVEVDRDPRAGGDRIKITGWLYGPKGAPIAAQSLFCNDCKNDTLEPKLQELARLLFSAAATGTGRLSVVTRPSGATVLVDGEKVGVSPLTHGLREGPHTITIELAGHQTVTRKLTIANGGESPLDLALVKIGGGGGGGSNGKLLAYGALGLGGVAIVTGAVLLFVVDEEPVTTPTTDPTYTEATVPGLVSLGAGVALAGVGGYLLYQEGKRGKRPAPVARLTHGGAVLGLAGSF